MTAIKSTPESKIQYEIRRALGLEPDLELNVNTQGVFKDDRGCTHRVGLGVGTPDLVGILAPSGRTFALEVKSATGRLTEEQKLCIARWRKLGAFVAVVRSADEAKQALQRAREGAAE
jgi:hypothetical protein